VAQVEDKFTTHPLALTMRANASDNPTWYQAMAGPEKDGYWRAMEVELETLVVGKNAWEVIPRTADMKVLPSTWAFKCKRFPRGLVQKVKSRFCVQGNCQIDGVDVLDTYAPVVSWNTVQLLLLL
jgi:hypothetical protein